MPVAAQLKLEALTRDLGSQAAVARTLGVSPSRVSRWLRSGEQPDAEHQARLDGLEFVLSRLQRRYRLETARKWLLGTNAFLGERRPIDLVADGRIAEVIAAIQADEADAYA